MSQADLQRVEQDLATLRSAVGTEPVITGDYLREMIVVALFGAYLVIAALAGWTTRLERLIAMAPFAAVAIWSQRRMFKRFQQERDRFPRRWRWYRAESVISVAAAIAAIGFLLFLRRFALDQSADARIWSRFLGPTFLFFFGLGLLIVAAVELQRRWMLPFAAALIAMAVVIPFCRTVVQGDVALGGGILLGALVSAVALRRQLRQEP
jgi:hypothetical protein